MEKIMKLKRFNCVTNLIAAITLCLGVSGTSAFAATDAIPIIHYVGVIPVQWDKEEAWSDMAQVKKTLSKDFSEAVKGSTRFSTLNDDLVSSIWSTPAGRVELARDYELQAFAALNISNRGDMVVITARLLSPKFETFLQESEIVAHNWLIESTQEKIVEKLKDLIQRMINRLPIDAHITSVNGQFVTVSAGTYQSVSVGDEFDVINPKIQTLHPANGSWLSFSSTRTGKIKIIEVKGRSSIGKIVSLTSEGSIAVNHGIRIEAISGRSRFARQDGGETFVNTQSNASNAIVPEMKPDGTASLPKEKPVEAPAVEQAAPKVEPAVEGKAEEAPSTENPPAEETEKSNEPSPSIAEILAPPGSDLEAYAGLKSWAIGGSGIAKAALPVWLINSVGVQVNRKFSESVLAIYGVDLGYGATGKGNSFGYGIHGGGFYRHKMKLIEQSDFVQGGLEADIRSMSIGGETSGGYNLTILHMVMGFGGVTKSQMLGTKLDWIADLRYSLQDSGQFGVKGAKEKVKSGDGMLFRFMGYGGERQKESAQYGAGFEFGTANYSLSNSKSATYNVISILGLARMAM